MADLEGRETLASSSKSTMLNQCGPCSASSTSKMATYILAKAGATSPSFYQPSRRREETLEATRQTHQLGHSCLLDSRCAYSSFIPSWPVSERRGMAPYQLAASVYLVSTDLVERVLPTRTRVHYCLHFGSAFGYWPSYGKTQIISRGQSADSPTKYCYGRTTASAQTKHASRSQLLGHTETAMACDSRYLPRPMELSSQDPL